MNDDPGYPNCGWRSDFPTFREAEPAYITGRLRRFVTDASPEQVRAWKDSIPPLQREVAEMIASLPTARAFDTILEYELPMESRRPDVVFLTDAAVVVLELKGKQLPSLADIDQVEAYARDLKCYHRECAGVPVIPVLVPTRARGDNGTVHSVRVLGPDAINGFIAGLACPDPRVAIKAEAFLAEDAYQPLPTLVAAARELFDRGDIRPIHRARAATDPAVLRIADVIHQAARTKSRHLVLLTGVPGAGKTLVGLRVVHAHYLDDLTVERDGAKPSAPAVYLSGNGPLVEVLQYELRQAGGDGKAFVRGVRDYVRTFSSSRRKVPPQHVLVFDEAQRAWDKEQIEAKHKREPGTAQSEPEHFIEFAERIPEWSVVIGLVGGGQEIHVGEEGGTGQWIDAVAGSPQPAAWTVHAPPGLARLFAGSGVTHAIHPALNLDTELRFHLATDIHEFVAAVLDRGDPCAALVIAGNLAEAGYHLRITRDLEVAKRYLRARYGENPLGRFGLVASSRDKDLVRFGIPNDFQSTKRTRFGPWYSDPENHPDGRSCRHLRDCVTEFGAQGLELDAVLLAWGTDFEFRDGVWSDQNARQYKRGTSVRDPHQLRLNAYRVMLTRGRDATVVFVPPIGRLDGTYVRLVGCGFVDLGDDKEGVYGQ